MKKKLTCHCGGVEAEINIPKTGIEKLMRCNCTLCKRKGYIIGVLGCLLYTSPSPRDATLSRMPSSA